jgi:two-component system, NarL family, sensor kinase
MLDEAGLPAALRWFCDGFTKRTDIAVDLAIASDINRLPAEIEAALFRVAQEGLTNVHRHSGSTKVRLSLGLQQTPDQAWAVLLEIGDNGKGMPPDLAALFSTKPRIGDIESMGIGLAGMRERLHSSAASWK